jgi:hypothetical protein
VSLIANLPFTTALAAGSPDVAADKPAPSAKGDDKPKGGPSKLKDNTGDDDVKRTPPGQDKKYDSSVEPEDEHEPNGNEQTSPGKPSDNEPTGDDPVSPADAPQSNDDNTRDDDAPEGERKDSEPKPGNKRDEDKVLSPGKPADNGKPDDGQDTPAGKPVDSDRPDNDKEGNDVSQGKPVDAGKPDNDKEAPTGKPADTGRPDKPVEGKQPVGDADAPGSKPANVYALAGGRQSEQQRPSVNDTPAQAVDAVIKQVILKAGIFDEPFAGLYHELPDMARTDDAMSGPSPDMARAAEEMWFELQPDTGESSVLAQVIEELRARPAHNQPAAPPAQPSVMEQVANDVVKENDGFGLLSPAGSLRMLFIDGRNG